MILIRINNVLIVLFFKGFVDKMVMGMFNMEVCWEKLLMVFLKVLF